MGSPQYEGRITSSNWGVGPRLIPEGYLSKNAKPTATLPRGPGGPPSSSSIPPSFFGPVLPPSYPIPTHPAHWNPDPGCPGLLWRSRAPAYPAVLGEKQEARSKAQRGGAQCQPKAVSGSAVRAGLAGRGRVSGLPQGKELFEGRCPRAPWWARPGLQPRKAGLTRAHPRGLPRQDECQSRPWKASTRLPSSTLPARCPDLLLSHPLPPLV